MRFFGLLGLQHVILFFFPTLVLVLLFVLALGHAHLQTRDSEEKKQKIVHKFPEGIEERDAPFPLALLLIILGFLLWALVYALGIGLLGVKL